MSPHWASAASIAELSASHLHPSLDLENLLLGQVRAIRLRLKLLLYGRILCGFTHRCDSQHSVLVILELDSDLLLAFWGWWDTWDIQGAEENVFLGYFYFLSLVYIKPHDCLIVKTRSEDEFFLARTLLIFLYQLLHLSVCDFNAKRNRHNI